jgi:hypothetical protein
MKRHLKSGLVLALFGMSILSAHAAVYYVDSGAGSDSNDGLSQSTPWKTLAKVNGAALLPGDSVLFNRGGQWRGSLQTKPGSAAGGKIHYAAYGAGSKPLLLGSIALHTAGDWVETASGSHIWESQVPVIGGERLQAVATGTYSAASGGASYATFSSDTQNHSAGAAASVKVSFSATQSTNAGDVQIFKSLNASTPLVAGHYYKLTFNAAASEAVTLTYPSISLMQNGGSYAPYASTLVGVAPTIGTGWATYEAYFQATASAADGRVNFSLGKLKPGITLNFDSFSVRECDGSKLLVSDVGSLIFDDAQASVGYKKLNLADLAQTGDFWYDAARGRVRVYSNWDPVVAYTQIEAALNRTIISGASDVEVRDFDLRYGGAHGIAFGNNTARVIVDGLDISFIGGSLLQPALRYGNGVQFWLSTQDAVVRNLRISQVYDVALTAQGDALNTVNGILFSNNYVAKSEQCFELWTRIPQSQINDVTFTGNTCVGSGSGWSHPQRGASGFDVLMYKNTADTTTNVKITNNIFYNAVNAVVRLDIPWTDFKSIDFSGNCYYQQQSGDPMLGLLLNRTEYDDASKNKYIKTVADFNLYFTTNTSASAYGDPQMVASPDGTLVAKSDGSCAAKGYHAPAI